MSGSSAISSRRSRSVESFGCAADAIGQIVPGLSLFAITRGQWSMIDAILAVLDQVGASHLSLWTWTVADYEVEVLERLIADGRILLGCLVIDHGARKKNASIIARWKSSFGPDSVRYVINHAKIATIHNEKFKLCLRGSMNLNHNPRFEQFDITEGGSDFDLVKEIESELPILSDNCSGADVYRASRVSESFEQEQLAFFGGVKMWAK